MGGVTVEAGKPVRFEAMWCASDLGEARPCQGTYERYPYESLPPLDAGRFDGGFGWLGEPGDPIPEQRARLKEIARSLADKGLALPADFATFQTHSGFHAELDRVSVTSCWSDLSEPLASPVEEGAHLVRFLRDQQDCVIWYLYLRPSGEVFVVHSQFDFEYGREGYDQEDEEYDEDDYLPSDEIFWCAPTFEQFAYRFRTENLLWRAVHKFGRAETTPELSAYLDHYRSAGALR